MAPPLCRASWLGRVPYEEAWRLQRDLAVRRSAGLAPDTLLLLEHPPVYTTGRRGPGGNLRTSPAVLGAPLIESDRGGAITFHGPGQLVAYPIVDLRATGLGVTGYVGMLEQVIIRTLSSYGIAGGRESGLTGVWVEGEKIAAIGVRVSRPAGAARRWVTSHGLAINVDVDLDWFQRIIPCGIADRSVTSMARLLGEAPPLRDVADRLAVHFGQVFRREMSAVPAVPSAEAALTGPRAESTIRDSTDGLFQAGAEGRSLSQGES